MELWYNSGEGDLIMAERPKIEHIDRVDYRFCRINGCIGRESCHECEHRVIGPEIQATIMNELREKFRGRKNL
jgi:hypothetical protein